MARPISATLLVSEFIPTVNPGEYTFTDGAFNNQTDETGNGALDVEANSFKLYVQATDLNTAAPIPGVVHRYKLTVATPTATDTLSGTILWDEPGVPADSPSNGAYCALCQSAGHGLSMIPSTGMYSYLPVGLDIQAMMLDTRDIVATGAIVSSTAADLVGPVTSVGITTDIAPGVITNAMLANGAVANLSGTNTGDETVATIKTKLAITTLSGSNTGDQVIPTTLPASDVSAWAKSATKPTYTSAEVGAQAAGTYATGSGTASGTNTGDETLATIKTKLGITTLSGSNTGDQVIPTSLPASDVSAWAKAATKPSYTAAEVGLGNVPNLSFTGSNTGDETLATIKTKLGITTLSGSNTGDQVIPTTLPASDVYSWAKAATKPAYSYGEISGTPSMPTTLPASDVYAWAKAATKPTYTAAEVGALSSSGNAATATVATNSTITSDNATATTTYLTYTTAVTGNLPLRAGSNLAYVPSTGSLTASGNITAYSDERLKANWKDLPSDFISQLAGVKTGVFDRVDTGETQVGVSAQSLQEVLPEAVMINADSGMLSVSYGNAALAACVVLAREVKMLRAELIALRG